MKTNKSISKRIRVTKNGKLIARKSGQNHFNAKEGGRTKAVKNRPVAISIPKRVRRSFLTKTSA